MYGEDHGLSRHMSASQKEQGARRHLSDRAENGRLAAVLSPDPHGGGAQFVPTEWKHVRVGDVVSDESLPADMVLLATSEPTGVAYVQTLDLDGESILVVLCSIVAALSGVWLHTHEKGLELAQFFHKKDYLRRDKDNDYRNYNYYGSVDGIDYSEIARQRPPEGDRIWAPKISVNTDPELVKLIRDRADTEQGTQTREFFVALATCNTIVPMIADGPDPKKKVIDYHGESPDEH